jgi:hypothetical protein
VHETTVETLIQLHAVVLLVDVVLRKLAPSPDAMAKITELLSDVSSQKHGIIRRSTVVTATNLRSAGAAPHLGYMTRSVPGLRRLPTDDLLTDSEAQTAEFHEPDDQWPWVSSILLGVNSMADQE